MPHQVAPKRKWINQCGACGSDRVLCDDCRRLQFPSPRRETSKQYIEYIRSLPCTVCLDPFVDAAHVQTRGSGGTDFAVVPLCRKHHTEQHTIGIRTFEEKHGVNLWEKAFRCLSVFAYGGVH